MQWLLPNPAGTGHLEHLLHRNFSLFPSFSYLKSPNKSLTCPIPGLISNGELAIKVGYYPYTLSYYLITPIHLYIYPRFKISRELYRAEIF